MPCNTVAPFAFPLLAQVKMRGKPVHFARWTPLQRNPSVLTAQRLLERVSRALRLGRRATPPPHYRPWAASTGWGR
jgi:hypothetical protein